jgi:tripartite-type tricarboxylate transporter receptor subunit TctC
MKRKSCSALGQRFVVENRPGAGGEIGISYAAKAAPDGYTLLHAPSIIILLPHVMKSVSYDLAKDFAPVMRTGLTQFALVVSPTLPVNSVKDLIALAKSKPGELTYASSGIGTPHQIFAEEFKTMTGTDIRHVPYKGAVPWPHRHRQRQCVKGVRRYSAGFAADPRW